MINFENFDNIIALTSYFNSNEICKQVIAESRWRDGDVVCPYCGERHCKVRKDGNYRCNKCKSNFSCLVGTIFENTKVLLPKWFVAMYLISSHKKGISSHQLARDIHVTQTTAWYMLQKVRLLYQQNDSIGFDGTVECDEVYIGGREKWKHKSMRMEHTQGRSTKTKTPVFGMAKRDIYVNKDGEEEPITYVHAFKVQDTCKDTLQTIIQQFAVKGSTVITDEHNAYNGLDKLGYSHAVINHGSDEFVNGSLYTNSIESFWSHFRRMIHGVYHDVSDKHLQNYIDEAVYRWNTKKDEEPLRFSHMFHMSIGLVAKWRQITMKRTA